MTLFLLFPGYSPSRLCPHHLRPVCFCRRYLWFHVQYLYHNMHHFICLSSYHHHCHCSYINHLYHFNILSSSHIDIIGCTCMLNLVNQPCLCTLRLENNYHCQLEYLVSTKKLVIHCSYLIDNTLQLFITHNKWNIIQ